MNAHRSIALASALAVLASGCSPTTAPNALPQAPSALASSRVTSKHVRVRMTLRIHIPKRVRRRNHYISPLTQSLAFSIGPGAACATCSGPQSADVGLTPSSPNCAPLDNGTTCTITLVLAPGNYIGSISTYDGPVGCQNSATCSALSANQSFPVQIVAGKANTPSIVLYGVPKYISLVPITKNVAYQNLCLGCDNTIFVPPLTSGAKILLYGADADFNLILGPGSPSFSLPGTPPTGWTASVSGNVLTLATGSAAKPILGYSLYEIDAQGPVCAMSGATCKFNTFFLAIGPLVAVADKTHGLVHVIFGDPYRQENYEYATVANGIQSPQDVKFDDSTGNLIVANSGYPTVGMSTLTIYAPPYTGAPISTIPVNDYPTHMAVDQAGDIALAGHQLGSSVQVFSPPTYTPTFIGFASNPTALAFEYHSHPKLWVAAGSSVAGYAYPYTGAASPTVAAGTPAGVDVDSGGNLWVTDASANTLTEYVAGSYSPGMSASNIPQATSVDAGSLLNVCGSNTAYGYFYASTLQLGYTTFTDFTAPCLVASAYTNAPIIASGNSTFSVLETSGSFYGTLLYPVNALAVYPSYRFGL
ncbi:MAG: hypothetical protein JO029_05935 [Candidatus Eremiobacteraeota bacterium]|nr:hypothetical protein [Candidatus Eremiobacteraeota bacterium]